MGLTRGSAASICCVSSLDNSVIRGGSIFAQIGLQCACAFCLANAIPRARMASILKRPVDLFFVSVFACFALIGITIGQKLLYVPTCKLTEPRLLHVDLVQSTYGAVLEQETLEYGAWPPRMVVDMYVWWCKNYDTLLGHNPIWYVHCTYTFL